MLFIVVTHLILKKFNWQVVAVLVVFAICLYIPGHILGTFESTASTLGKDIVKVATGAEDAGAAGSARWKIWTATADIIKEYPVFGIGFEGVKAKRYVGPPYNIRPHNEFLQMALFHGIPALLLYFTGCLMVFIRALRKKASLDAMTLVCLTAAFSYLVSSFFGLTVYSAAPYLFLFLGMGYVVEEVKKPEVVQGAKATQKTVTLNRSGKKKKK
jgi:O-antigen ligase